MTRVLCLDAVGGAAGDMILASLIDLGVDAQEVERTLAGLGLSGWAMRVQATQRGSVTATRVHFEPEDRSPHSSEAPSRHDSSHRHDHGHPEEQGHSHAHGHSHGHSHAHSHAHSHEEDDETGQEPHFPNQPERSWSVIRALLQASTLPPTARERALGVFQRLAEAEARVHGSAVEEVHFHEVGGVDAILDIVGCAVALELLGVDEVIAGPLPIGRGWTRCAHGRIPLPAPATLLLLQGWPTEPGVDRVEQVTPTGAAIWTTLGRAAPLPSMTIEGVGYGAGARHLDDRPNVVRALVGTLAAAPPADSVEVTLAQVDDMSSEHLSALFGALFEAGALDATATPTHMKKQRVGLRIEALSPCDRAEAVAEAFLRHSTTFGVRQWTARRTVLDRWHESVETPWGPVRIKVGALHGEVLQAAPEYDDVARAAQAGGRSTLVVHAAAVAAWHQRAAKPDA